MSRDTARMSACVTMTLFVSCSYAEDAGWDSLLKKYVSTESRVDYRRWKADGVGTLDGYLQQIASAASDKAELINAYNALTIRWVLQNYPIESIWRTPHPFTEARHTLNGEKISLDAIEARLRKMGDPRIHAALVCAARSCPPLRREAYVAARLDQQLDDNARAWLANGTWNQFHPDRHMAVVSTIFKWYRADFEAGGGSVEKFLERYGPPGVYRTIQYKPYHWGLNDTSALGKNYSGAKFYWDYLHNKL